MRFFWQTIFADVPRHLAINLRFIIIVVHLRRSKNCDDANTNGHNHVYARTVRSTVISYGDDEIRFVLYAYFKSENSSRYQQRKQEKKNS
jgi:hypothetical protein